MQICAVDARQNAQGRDSERVTTGSRKISHRHRMVKDSFGVHQSRLTLPVRPASDVEASNADSAPLGGTPACEPTGGSSLAAVISVESS